MQLNQKLVGISLNPTKADGLELGSEVHVYHDAKNTFSTKAIAVKFGEIHLGHISEAKNPAHQTIFDNLPMVGTVARVARLEKGEDFAKFREGEITSLEITLPMPHSDIESVESFSEPGVMVLFDKKNHTYTYGKKKLVSCSSYVKKWIKEFDKNPISAAYAKSLGCKQQDVLDLWEGGGSISADFGTVGHKALEHYEKFAWLAELIMVKKGGPNKALPTHPILRDIVEKFFKTLKPSGTYLQEVLLTSVVNGLCGRADKLKIIDPVKKICRVQDYKFNIDCEQLGKVNFLGEFRYLPTNKLSEYNLKMSFYANLLMLAGWTVEGLDAFVYDGEWKHYPMDVLSMDFNN